MHRSMRSLARLLRLVFILPHHQKYNTKEMKTTYFEAVSLYCHHEYTTVDESLWNKDTDACYDAYFGHFVSFGQFRYFWAILDRLGLLGNIWDHLGPFGALWDHL